MRNYHDIHALILATVGVDLRPTEVTALMGLSNGEMIERVLSWWSRPPVDVSFGDDVWDCNGNTIPSSVQDPDPENTTQGVTLYTNPVFVQGDADWERCGDLAYSGTCACAATFLREINRDYEVVALDGYPVHE